MKVIRRWALMMAITTLNVELFSVDDWKFYLVAGLTGVAVGNLFKDED